MSDENETARENASENDSESGSVCEMLSESERAVKEQAESRELCL